MLGRRQIFIKRSLVDQLVYAAEPYGPVDAERMPVSSYINGDTNFNRGLPEGGGIRSITPAGQPNTTGISVCACVS